MDLPPDVLPLDRFLRYDELTDVVHRLADAHPDLLSVESIGVSHEGRHLWLATVTDQVSGSHDEKPAMWVDANIHAVELTGSVAALHLLGLLVGSDDPRVARARRTRTFYVVPRVNPDGAELALADHPRFLRSSTRPWPWPEGDRLPGLHPEDVDGDGRLLTMRVPDPNGNWKAHPDESRLLVGRAIDDGPDDGPYYRLLAEGLVHEPDGFTVPTPMPPEGLDLNRNFPAGWGTKQRGGDFPGSEPEIQALLRAITERPNVCGYNAFHTCGGVLLRPSSTVPDAQLPPVDVWTWAHLGQRGTALTGYPVHSVYEDFTWDRSDLMSGASDDWAYEHLGVYGWTTEFWDVIHHATGERAPTSIWVTGPTVEQELAVLRWADELAPGRLYVDWYPFDHPQLGPVELGGWDELRTWANPPPELLAAEVAPHAAFQVALALAAPCVEVVLAEATPLGEGLWRVRAGIANTGWLPTTVSDRARRENLVLPLVVELELPEGVEVVGSPARLELGQLAGKSGFHLTAGSQNDGTPDRTLATWLVRAGEDSDVVVTARHPRAGTARATVALLE